MQLTEEYLNEVLEERIEMGLKGRESSKSHLKSALYDWRVEKQWEKESSCVISYEGKGYAFLTFTVRNPKYCVLRHLVTLEEFRGQGIGTSLMEMMYAEMRKREYRIVRFFADIPSVGFYEKNGYHWHGKSKTGLSFTYTDVETMKLVPVIPRDVKRLV